MGVKNIKIYPIKKITRISVLEIDFLENNERTNNCGRNI
jgi:hypothetical protein